MQKVYTKIESIVGNVITLHAAGVRNNDLAIVKTKLGNSYANVIKLDHDQTKVTDSFKKVVLTVTVETHNEQHIQKIIQALNANGYEIQKIY